MAEEWRDIPGYEGLYQASTAGRIRSLDRDSEQGFRRGVVLSMRPHPNGGHLQVGLSKQGRNTTFKVHRLVLATFVGPCPEGMEGCHNNGDVNDNSLENLRWDTRLANIHDSIRHGTHNSLGITHCKRGHEFSPENTRFTQVGARACRICDRMRSMRNYMKHRAVTLARKRFRTAQARFCEALNEYREALVEAGREKELSDLQAIVNATVAHHTQNGNPA